MEKSLAQIGQQRKRGTLIITQQMIDSRYYAQLLLWVSQSCTVILKERCWQGIKILAVSSQFIEGENDYLLQSFISSDEVFFKLVLENSTCAAI